MIDMFFVPRYFELKRTCYLSLL